MTAESSPTPQMRSVLFGADGSVSLTGYTPAEVHDLLAAYREHVRLMADLTSGLTVVSGPGSDAASWHAPTDV